MTLINLTPHALVVLAGEQRAEIQPSGNVARVAVTRVQCGEVAGLPVYHSQYGSIVGLPEPQDGVAFVVSALVRLACPNRLDVFSPGELVRDASGQPIGCKGLEGNGGAL